jgi:hypothetical protein
LYYNNQPIPTIDDYFYQWDAYFSNEGNWHPHDSGYGEDGASISGETLPGYSISFKVTVSDVVNHLFTGIESGPEGPFSIPEVDPGDYAATVTFLAKDENGNSTSLVAAEHWRYSLPSPQWKNGFRSFLSKDYNQIIKATPNYIVPLQQKLLFWNNISEKCQNYNSFLISGQSTYQIQPQYWSVENEVTICNYLLSASADTIGTIFFKDPWFVKDGDPAYYDSPYGYRNLGLDAVFEEQESPFNPNSNASGPGSEYKGVFLEQPFDDPSNPYYSVYTIMPPFLSFHGENFNFFFTEWQSDNATFQDAYEEATAVVFHAANAEVKALYKSSMASSSNTAVASGGSRKSFRIPGWQPDGEMPGIFMVYEDGGDIWFKQAYG